MNKETKLELNQLLKNNSKWPIILEGIDASEFKNSTLLPATTKSEDLSVINGKPWWILSLEKRINNLANVLIIDGIDEVPTDEQIKFKQILDEKGVNGYSFPQNTRIVLTIKSGNREKVNSLIQSLCLYYKVD